MAAAGFTPNSRMSMGVISAPPPAPVIPTIRPTRALPTTIDVLKVSAQFPILVLLVLR
jgi:hypothetical protein